MLGSNDKMPVPARKAFSFSGISMHLASLGLCLQQPIAKKDIPKNTR
jgi:hypothetical protein